MTIGAMLNPVRRLAPRGTVTNAATTSTEFVRFTVFVEHAAPEAHETIRAINAGRAFGLGRQTDGELVTFETRAMDNKADGVRVNVV